MKVLIREPRYFENILKEIILLAVQTLIVMNPEIVNDQVQLQMYIEQLLSGNHHEANYCGPVSTILNSRTQRTGLYAINVILMAHSNVQKFM